jgi:hypothetical protein
MRIPALPQSNQFKVKSKGSLWKVFRKIVVKRIEKKRNFVRIPPRE